MNPRSLNLSRNLEFSISHSLQLNSTVISPLNLSHPWPVPQSSLNLSHSLFNSLLQIRSDPSRRGLSSPSRCGCVRFISHQHHLSHLSLCRGQQKGLKFTTGIIIFFFIIWRLCSTISFWRCVFFYLKFQHHLEHSVKSCVRRLQTRAFSISRIETAGIDY